MSGLLLFQLLMATLKSGLLLGVVAIVCLVFRRAPARTRSLLWAGALIAMLILPVAAGILPRLAVPIPQAAGKMIESVRGQDAERVSRAAVRLSAAGRSSPSSLAFLGSPRSEPGTGHPVLRTRAAGSPWIGSRR